MDRRERHHDDERPTKPGPPAGDGSNLRAAGEQLLARGADAIERALSQDSAKYLAANRQEGGQ